MKKSILWVVFAFTVISIQAADLPLVDARAPFGKLPLVQEIDCGAKNPDLMFIDLPSGVSKVETILGKKCRVIPNSQDKATYFAYVVGEGKNLQPGKSYLLTVEYPEDIPRSFHIGNWGCETMKGVATGTTVGDVLKGKYTNHNPESLQYPLSKKFRTWKQLFHLHNRFFEIKRGRSKNNRTMNPEDGFFVIIAQPESKQAPMSAGAAVSKIRLFEVPDLSKYQIKTTLPEGLPKRRLFWREEMADGVIHVGHKPEQKLKETRGVDVREDWLEYKCKLMQFLGMNTFCKDLLEFGHNQGWDCTPKDGGGANDWYNQSADPQHWSRILERIAKYKFDVLPYYEYAGSIGQKKDVSIGTQRRCISLKGNKNYTHVTWCQKTNADLADPDYLKDAKQVLEYTIVRHKDKVNFVGAWFRPRPEANPISFNKKDLKRFSKEANDGKRIMRSQLQSDKALLDKYFKWWFLKRKEFLEGLADYLRENVNKKSFVMYTTDASEPGFSLPARMFAPKGNKKPWTWKSLVATDQKDKWQQLLNSPRYSGDKRFQFLKVASEKEILEKDAYLKALTSFRGTWGNYEWDLACPPNDPQNYKDSDKVLLSYSFNRIYTVNNPKAFNAFRTKDNLAIIRHYSLNENEMTNGKDNILGYFISDVEQSGPFSMASEALAMANGDPNMIGYLAGNNFNRGYPEYARNFNAAFLSLPALPSKKLSGAASDPKVVVREIKTPKHGTYLSVVNTAFTDKKNISITLPTAGTVTDATTGEALAIKDGKISLSLYPCQLQSLLIK